jgi:hypothetical protein
VRGRDPATLTFAVTDLVDVFLLFSLHMRIDVRFEVVAGRVFDGSEEERNIYI